MDLLSNIFSVAPNRILRFFFLLPISILPLIIMLSAILCPYFESNLMSYQYNLLYSNLGNICHQYPSRSYYIFGSNIGICSRCFSIYLSVFLGSIFLIFFKIKLPLRRCFQISFLFVLPIFIDGITQLYGLRESNNFFRSITGLLFGLSISLSCISLIVDFFVYRTNSYIQERRKLKCNILLEKLI